MLLPSHWLPVKIHQQPCPFGMFWCPLIRIWETSPTYHPTHKIRCTNIANFGHSEKPQHLSGSVPVGHHTLPQIFPSAQYPYGKSVDLTKGQTFPASRATQKWSGRSTSKCPPQKIWRNKNTHKNAMENKREKNISSNLTTEKSSHKHLWASMVLITAPAPKGGWHRIHLQFAKSCQIDPGERFENHNIKSSKGKKMVMTIAPRQHGH